MTEAWFDPRGCLSEAGVAAVRAAAPAPPPGELAGHIVACARCQARLLALGRPASVATARPEGWQRWRLAIASAALLVMALFALWSIWRLAGGE